MSIIYLALLVLVILLTGKIAYNTGYIRTDPTLSSVGEKVGEHVAVERVAEHALAGAEVLELFDSQPATYGKGCVLPEIKKKNYIDHIPKGATDYPPTTFNERLTPPLWKWKSILNYYYYDPWWAYSYPYNRLCDAYGRRQCAGSWYPRTCYREQYNKCVTENLY